MKRILVSALLSAAILTAGAPGARADPLVVASGALIFDHEGDFFFLTGDGFQLNSNEPFYYFPRVIADTCTICRPGDIVNTSFRTPGEVYLGSGSAVFGGAAYAEVAWQGTLDFTVRPVVFPDTEVHTYFPIAPFSFTGVLRAFRGTDELFSTGLTGTGLMALPYFRSASGYEWEEGRVNYVFGLAETPDPIPEPATMALFASGLAALAVRRRKRKGA